MLTIFRRHGPNCTQGKKYGRRYKRCKCPVWIEGAIGGKILARQSLGTRSWTESEERRRKLEAAALDGPAAPIALEQAAEEFLADSRRRNLATETQRKQRQLLRELCAFASSAGFRELRVLGVEETRRFVTTWSVAPITAVKKLERLRTFFSFCIKSRWIGNNPAKQIDPPKARSKPTMPFTSEQMQTILDACEHYKDSYGRVEWHAKRVRAFALLMRYSGLRIGDAARLAKDRIDKTGKLFLYTQKSGTPVYLPLPPAVIAALEQFPHANERYFFWSGTSTREAAAGLWNKVLRRVFQATAIRDAHSHRFRDTFAVELLKQGVPLDRVSILLGHSSVGITEKHYAPWVRERQEQLERDVLRTWLLDPFLAAAQDTGPVQ